MESMSLEQCCKHCLHLDTRGLVSLQDWWKFGRSSTIVDFERSSQAGCLGCNVVFRVLQYHRPDLEKEQVIRLGKMRMRPHSFRLHIMDETESRSADWDMFEGIEISSFPGQHCPWSAIAAAGLVSESTGSDQAVVRVRSWLDQCLGRHRTCRFTKPTINPTRILQIGGPTSVKLCVSPDPSISYICLSHCWGTTNLIKLRSCTIAEYQKCIIWGELPRTFQEAISFAYRLGYTYIWIDSLCIIQDSVDDWRREGSKMASIYKGAILTLFATHSSNSDGGCYIAPHHEHQSHVWSLTDMKGQPYSLHSRIPLHHEQLTSNSLPLLRRGWALQERTLSQRILYFTEDEVVWECPDALMCQCTHIPRFSNRIIAANSGRPSLMACESLHMTQLKWQQIVEAYSKMSLTYPKDVFPALQGFANSMPSTMGSYVAGLWTATLDVSLSWYAIKQSRDRRRPKAWRAPTWSWASTTEHISWFSFFLSLPAKVAKNNPLTYITIVNATVAPKGHDETGEIVSGKLVLRARGLKGHLLGPDHPDAHQLHGETRLVLRTSDGAVMCGNEVPPGVGVFWDYAIDTYGLCSSNHVAEHAKVVEVLVIKIQGCSMRAGLPFKSISVWLIFVHSVVEQDAFERIGLLALSEQGDESESKQLMMKLDRELELSPEVEIQIV